MALARIVALTKGHLAWVDYEDYERVAKRKWCASEGAGGKVYAARGVKVKGKSKLILMHREILGAKDGEVVDHISGNTLDNRKCNLRIGTQSQNCGNSAKHVDANGSKFKGVSKSRGGKFVAEICVAGKRTRKGGFRTEDDAAKQYDQWARDGFGDFAKTNLKPEGWVGPDIRGLLKQQGM